MVRRLCLGDGTSTVVKRELYSKDDSYATTSCLWTNLRYGIRYSITAPVVAVAYELLTPSRHIHSFLLVLCQENRDENRIEALEK